MIDSVEHILVCYISLLWNNSYNNIDTICNPISYIQHDIQHYMQQYAISRIACQWCIEYHQKLQPDFLCVKFSFSDSAIYYMAWIL